MFKGIIDNDRAVTANSNVPFTVERNTNGNTRYNAATNEVQLNTSGYYNVMINMVATAAAATPITAQLYADGVPVAGDLFTVVPAAIGDAASFTIIDCIKVNPTLDLDKARISVRFDEALTVNSGVFLVQKVR